MRFAGRRIAAALTAWPDRRSWIAAARELVWALPLIGALAWTGGLLRFDPVTDPLTLARVTARTVVLPAIAEEVLFRALIVPRPAEPFPAWQAALCVAAFVLWHPFQAFTFSPPWGAVFLDPWFLAAVAVLGAALVRIYRATGSIWPCVAAHWLVVASWKLLLGGPFG